MRRFADLYVEIKEDRDFHARSTAQLVLDREWDRASMEAQKYLSLQGRIDAMILGTSGGDDAA